jgi:ribosomal protein S18 acetylase RimI-like enzyme
MSVEQELYYFQRPVEPRPASPDVEVLPVQEFLQDELACRALWDLLGSQFRTRGKFLSIWPGVRFVALYRTGEAVDGLLLISAMMNWQIDYVVVRPEARGRGIAAALVNTAVNRAFELRVPYVMLTSRESLRPLYEGQCGFRVVQDGAGPTEVEFCDSGRKKG